MTRTTRLARPIAPEDLVPGVYVMTLHEVHECYIPVQTYGSAPEFTRTSLLTRPCETGLPTRIVGVCLPYVSVALADGKTAMLDTRGVRLARVDTRFAKKALAPHAGSADEKHGGGGGAGKKRRLRLRRRS